MNKPDVKSNSIYNCIRISHISAAWNTRISVILSHYEIFRSAVATWQEMLLIFHIFHSRVTWAEIPSWFIFWGVWECDGMLEIAAGSSLRGRIGVVTQTPDCHGALNRRFVPGLTCSLELRLPETNPTERYLTQGKSLVSASTFSQMGADQVPGFFIHPRMHGWILTAYE